MSHFTMDEFRRRLILAAPSSASFGFQGLRAADSITVEECLPLSFLLACDWGLDGPEWDARLAYFAVERFLPKDEYRRIVWTHSSIVQAYDGKLGEEFRLFLARDEEPKVIIPYRSTEFLARLETESRGRISILANPLELKTRLDDKVAFREEAQRRGLSVTPGEVIEVGALDASILKRWGPRTVVTERVGSSGNQTHLVTSSGEIDALRAQLVEKSGRDALSIANRFLEGPAAGACAFVFRGKPRMSHPSIMFTGLEGCSMHRFDYAGSDYGAYTALPPAAHEVIRKATLEIGEWVAGLGYQGVFGVDFVIHEGEPYVLELNPRLLGTTQIMGELEKRTDAFPPSVYWHLADLLGAGGEEAEAEDLITGLGIPRLSGYQLLLRNTRAAPVRVGRSLTPGVYVMTNEGPRFVRVGNRTADLVEEDEILLTCSPPERGTTVDPRGVFFKLEGIGSIYERGEEQVTPEAKHMIRSFIDALGLTNLKQASPK